MKNNKQLHLILAVALVSILCFNLISATCLTDTERSTLTNIAIKTNSSADIMINLYERICSANYTDTKLAEFNVSMTNQVNSQLNQSDLTNVLRNVADVINRTNVANNNSYNLDSRLNELEMKINNRIDNNSLSLVTQFNNFKNDVNSQLVEKQSSSLSTNRIIIIIVLGLVAIGVFFYFSRKKTLANHNINPAPYDMRNFGEGDDNDEQQNDTHKNKAKSRR